MKDSGWTPEMINDMLYKMDVCADRAEHVNKKQQHQRVFGNKPTLLITISFDKEIADIIAEMELCIRLFRESAYNWVENALYSFEFYSKEGWNPHIHLVTEQNQPPSMVMKAVKRGPCFKKTKSYNVNVRKGTDKYHYEYIKGNKKEEKLENSEKDEEFRQSNNLKSYYNL